MAKIISFGGKSGSEKNTGKGNPFKSVWTSFQSLDKFVKFFILTALLIIAATPFITANLLETRQRAQQAQTTTVYGENLEPSFASNELLIKIKKESRGKIKEGNPEDTGMTSLDKLNKELKVKKFEKIAKAGKNSKTDADIFAWYKVTLEGEGKKIADKPEKALSGLKSDNSAASILQGLIIKFRSDPNIEIAEPNYIVNSFATPNDPYYSSSGSFGQSYPDLWGIKKINSEAAWDQTTGSANIIVAGIDTGVDRNHEDLQGQMWVNTAEIQNNGIDDDGNGYIDDYYGWDWNNNDNDPMDDNGHGTHTVGTIAAVGNNAKGVVGVNWTSKIMALKFLGSLGSGYTYNGIKALQYAADMGAKVSSNSWGCRCNTQAMDDAIKYEHDKGMVVAVSAGNSNADALDYSPASSDMAMTIAASDPNDIKASFSNWGEKIDVIAPGVNILSTRAAVNPMCTAGKTVGTNYCYVSGTSMAAPHVAGLAALLLAKDPTLSNEEIRQLIRMGAVDLGTTGKDNNFGFGLINAGTSIGLSGQKPPAPIITSPRSRSPVANDSLNVIGIAAGPNFSKYTVEVAPGRTSSWKLITNSTTPITNGVLATINTNTQLAEGKNMIRLTVFDTNGKTYQYQVNDVTVGNLNLNYGQIKTPLVFAGKGLINITGIAHGDIGVTFTHYTVEWRLSSNPSAPWSTTGISLTNGGLLGMSNNVLGTWDTSGLTDGELYSLRLRVYSAEHGLIAQNSIKLTIDPNLVPGWPKYIDVPSISRGYEPIENSSFADLDGDGTKEIIILTKDNMTISSPGKIWAYRANGSMFPGFPITMPQAQSLHFSSYNDLNTADIDNDGKSEIIVSGDNPIAPCNEPNGRYVYIYKSDTSRFTGWPKQFTGFHQVSTTPSVADINNDGQKELVIIDGSGYLHVMSTSGVELAGFPKQVIFNSVNSPTLCWEVGVDEVVLSDITGDNKPEILAENTRIVYAFDSNGNLLPGWPFDACGLPTAERYKCFQFKLTYLATGDIDGDGKQEVVISLVDNQTKTYSLYAIKGNGMLLSGWPKVLHNVINNLGDDHMNEPSVVDLDHDGKDEIVIYNSGVKVYGNSGLEYQFDNYGADALDPHAYPLSASFALGDTDKNGSIEIIGHNAYGYYVIKNIQSGGELAWIRDAALSDTEEFRFFYTPSIVADIDNDGQMEIVGVHSPSYGETFANVYLWKLPKAGNDNNSYNWPMFGHDSARTARLIVDSQGLPSPSPIPSSPPVSSPTPTPTRTPTPTPVPGDTTAPTVSITAPVNGAIVARNFTITLQAGATDNVAISKVDFLVNGSLICSDTTSPYSCNWKTSGKPNTNYTISAKAYDTSGNTAINAVNVKSSK